MKPQDGFVRRRIRYLKNFGALLLIALVAPGCAFDPPEVSPGDPGPDPVTPAPDDGDNPGTPDVGSGPDTPAPACPSDYAPERVDVCGLTAPAGPLVLAAGSYVYDTDSETFTTGSVSAPPVTQTVAQAGGPDALAWSVDGFDLQSGATLRVVGSKPLLIGSRATITIAGRLDVSSNRSGNLAFEAGAGGQGPGNGIGCTAGPGQNDDGGGGGGGAGGFQGVGGGGGPGDSNDSPGGNDGTSNGGDGGDGLAEPTVVRGGCPGASGGNGNGGAGQGGVGGGAVALASVVAITVSGTIEAGGSGGGGGRQDRGGGGGGGSGGYIHLDAPTLSIANSAILAANGGGGGEGGASNGEGRRGDDGDATTARADGGDGGRGAAQLGDGARGSGGSTLDGETATDLREGGGGGGGGGAGFIILRSLTPDVQSSDISPSAASS